MLVKNHSKVAFQKEKDCKMEKMMKKNNIALWSNFSTNLYWNDHSGRCPHSRLQPYQRYSQ